MHKNRRKTKPNTWNTQKTETETTAKLRDNISWHFRPQRRKKDRNKWGHIRGFLLLSSHVFISRTRSYSVTCGVLNNLIGLCVAFLPSMRCSLYSWILISRHLVPVIEQRFRSVSVWLWTLWKFVVVFGLLHSWILPLFPRRICPLSQPCLG